MDCLWLALLDRSPSKPYYKRSSLQPVAEVLAETAYLRVTRVLIITSTDLY